MIDILWYFFFDDSIIYTRYLVKIQKYNKINKNFAQRPDDGDKCLSDLRKKFQKKC